MIIKKGIKIKIYDNKNELYISGVLINPNPINKAAALLMGLGFIRTPEMYSSFLLSYIFILIPFFIINGLLTGSYIPSQIVWYNDLHNLGVRIGTIPFEDIFYGFSLLFLPLYLKEEMSIRKSLKL